MSLRHWLALGLAAPVLPLLLWSCTSHPLKEPSPQATGEIAQFREVNPIKNVDIVFVVDNSGSMAQEQNNLGANFPRFMDELSNVQGADIRIGVVSSDLGAGTMTTNGQCTVGPGDDGAMCTTRGIDRCTMCGVQGRYLRTVNPNFTGAIRDVFTCVARLGTTGCSFEHSIGALVRSLDNQANGDFLRPDAYLAFVIITDEEDCTARPDTTMFASPTLGQDWSLRCSLEAHSCNGRRNDGTQDVNLGLTECQAATDGQLIPVQELVDQVLAKKGGDPNMIIAAGIFGWPLPGQEATARYRQDIAGFGGERGMRPICESANLGSATPAYRVKSFVQSFPNNSVYSICQGDFREAMQRIGAKIRTIVGPPCIDARLADIDVSTPAVDADCNVTERRPLGNGKYEEVPLQKCVGGDTAPCWRVIPSTGCTAGHMVEIDRQGAMPAEGTQQSIRCLTCLNNTSPGCRRP